MIKHYLAILLFCFFSIGKSEGGLIFLHDSIRTIIPWKFEENKPSIRLNTQAALHGDYGLQLVSIPGESEHCSAILPFMKDSWHRFYFSLDSLGTVSSSQADNASLNETGLLCYSFKRNLPYVALRFVLQQIPRKKDLFLACRLIGSPDSTMTWQIRRQIVPKRVYCVEYRISFMHSDSIGVECFVDGTEWFISAVQYKLTPDMMRVIPYNSFTGNILWKVFLGDIAVSSERIYSIPSRPVGIQEAFSNTRTELFSEPFETFFLNERIVEKEWRLFMQNEPLFPLYQAVSRDSSKWERQILPFPLDSGSYFWQLRQRNQFGAWSDWSRKKDFTVTGRLPFAIQLKDFSVSADRKQKAPVDTLIPETWYYINVSVKSYIEWIRVGYMIICFRDTSYTYGHMGNKGGIFLPASNYVFNLSLADKDYVFFERQSVGSLTTTLLKRKAGGLYTDPKSLVVDTANGFIQFRFKFLGSALPGLWQASVFLKDDAENFSNLKTRHYWINRKQDSANGWILRIIVAVLGIVFLLLAIRYNVKKMNLQRNTANPAEPSMATKDYERILTFIRAHLSDVLLSPEETRNALKISKIAFYAAMTANDRKFTNLLNQERVEAAKKLLIETAKDVTAISEEVGFANQTYFSTIFKKHTGLAPLEFRKKAR